MTSTVFKKLETWLLLSLLVILSACAQGETLANSQVAIGVLPDDKARVFIYRKGKLIGSGVQPSIHINGLKTNDCIPGGVFVVELTEGQHEIWINAFYKQSRVSLDLKAGDVKYIECKIKNNLVLGRMDIEEVNAIEGKKVTSELVYTGTYSD